MTPLRARRFAPSRRSTAAAIGIVIAMILVLIAVSICYPVTYQKPLLFALCLPFIALMHWQTRRISGTAHETLIRIDLNGVYCRSWSEKVIPWSNIASVYAQTVYTTGGASEHCMLRLTTPVLDPPMRDGKLLAPRWYRRNDVVMLSVAGTDASFAQLVDAIGQYHPRVVVNRGVQAATAIAAVLVSLAAMLGN